MRVCTFALRFKAFFNNIRCDQLLKIIIMDQKQQSKARRQQNEETVEGDEDGPMEVEPIQINQRMAKGQMDEEDEDWQSEGEMNIDFLFLDPNENQFSSVKLLVNGYLDGLSFRSSELAELIVKQAQIGTMVGGDDEDEDEPEYKKKYREQNVFGFVTLLNLGINANVAVLKEIIKYVLEKSQAHNSAASHQALSTLLLSKPHSVGLLINERILNLAPQVVPVIHNQLLEDLKWLQKEDKQEWANYNFEYLLVLTKVYKEKSAQTAKKLKNTGNLQLASIIYQKFEDFLLLQKCDQYFAYEAHSSRSQSDVTNQTERDYPDEVCNRVVMLIKAESYYAVVPEIAKQLGP